MTPQINCLEKTSTVLRVPTPIYGVTKEINGKMFISIVKAHTMKWQIYPDEVFYTKDLLPMRVTISLCIFNISPCLFFSLNWSLVGLGNSILKVFNGIKLPSMSVCTLYAILGLSYVIRKDLL